MNEEPTVTIKLPPVPLADRLLIWWDRFVRWIRNVLN